MSEMKNAIKLMLEAFSSCTGYKGLTLVEDLPSCRELICRLCRELTSQLWKHGYFLRPVEA